MGALAQSTDSEVRPLLPFSFPLLLSLSLSLALALSYIHSVTVSLPSL